jgi:thiamine transport system permease protein
VLPYLAALALPGFGGGRAGLPPSLVPVTLFTLKQALLSTLLALLLGLPGAWFGFFRRRLRALLGIPFALPPILVVLAFVLFLGNSGWLGRFQAFLGGPPLRVLYRPLAVVLAHGFYNAPIVIRLAGDGIAQARRHWSQAAASLGAAPAGAAFTVILPLAAPSVLASALLVFLYSFTSFAVVLVLGGGPAATTLAVEIYRAARISVNYRAAGILALVETLIALGAFLGWGLLDRALTRRRDPGTGEALPEAPFREGFAGSLIGGIYAAVLLILVILPILSVVLQSFMLRPGLPLRFSLQPWLGIAGRVIPALGRSLLLAGASASLACLIAVAAAGSLRLAGERSLPGTLVRVFSVSPLISSGVVLGLGWLLLYGRGSLSLASLAAFHAVLSLPFAFNSVLQGFRDIPANTANVALSAGASPLTRLLTVDLPLALQRLRSAWAFSAAISLGELNALLMLGPESFETLPLLIYRAASSYRYGSACAAGTLLILCCAAAFLLAETRSGGSPRGA